MNYLKFLFSKKWLLFTAVFLVVNVAGIWAMIQDDTNWYWVVILLVMADCAMVIFSYCEYLLKYPKK